jgi:hypothetical protein
MACRVNVSLAAVSRVRAHRPTVLLSRKCSCTAAGPKTNKGRSTMETMKLRAMQRPGSAGELLDSFIRVMGRLAGDARELVEERRLTPALEKLAQRSLDEGSVWRAWTDDREMWLWACEVSLPRSRERGLPVMDVRRYNENGCVEDSGTWVRVRNEDWQRCTE